MVRLYNAETNELIGEIANEQFQFMMDILEEEGLEDHDYYINSATLDYFAENGAESQLMELLRKALGEKEEMDIRWEKDTGLKSKQRPKIVEELEKVIKKED